MNEELKQLVDELKKQYKLEASGRYSLFNKDASGPVFELNDFDALSYYEVSQNIETEDTQKLISLIGSCGVLSFTDSRGSFAKLNEGYLRTYLKSPTCPKDFLFKLKAFLSFGLYLTMEEMEALKKN